MQIIGGQAALARALSTPLRKIGQPHVYKWLNSPNPDQMPPAEYCPSIERATGVRCEELRPDVDWSVLRNSDCHHAAHVTEQDPGMAFGEFGEPRTGLERREGDRRQVIDPDFGDFGEPRDGERRVEDRRQSASVDESV